MTIETSSAEQFQNTLNDLAAQGEALARFKRDALDFLKALYADEKDSNLANRIRGFIMDNDE